MNGDGVEGKHGQLRADLLADLMGAFVSLQKTRVMLTDALALEHKKQRQCVAQARHSLGSALQILQSAIDDVKAIRSEDVRKAK